jgi:hypothetical protein
MAGAGMTVGEASYRGMPRSDPSAQGVDAAGVLGFLDAVERSGMDMHSLMLVRHGHVVVEGWWAPYRADRAHLLYSLSKSFTSTAARRGPPVRLRPRGQLLPR